MMESIQAEIISIVITIIGVCAGIVTKKVVSFLEKKGMVSHIKNNEQLVKIAVEAVEQTYKQLNGKEKFNVAKTEIVKLMNEKGIKISDKEIDLLIESTVKKMKEEAQKELNN